LIVFNILGRHERSKAAALGVANVITAMLVEDWRDVRASPLSLKKDTVYT
jgi:hypothetical protein